MIFQITVRETGKSFPCGSDEFVLTAMLRSRLGPITYGCCGGGCGVCRMRIVSGVYIKEKKMSRAHVSEADETEDVVLLCCVKPGSDLLIEAVEIRKEKRKWDFVEL